MKQRSQRSLRVLSFIVAFVMVMSMLPASAFAVDADTVVYLKPNSNWLIDNARFAVYCFDNGEKWVSMSGPNEEGYYKATVPAGYPSLIFCRMNPGTLANNWNNKWNQTGDLTLPTDGTNCFTVKDGTWDKGGGSWSTYTEPTYIIAGDSTAVFGTAWAPDNTANQMIRNAQGKCEKTYERVPAGTYSFKVTDGTWNNAWPSSNYSFTLDAISDVTITFDPVNRAVSHTATTIVEEPVTDVTVHFRNTGLWSEVYYHAWIENGDNDTALTSWPGRKLSERADNKNWYTVELTDLNAANGIGIVFNNGSDSAKTADIMIDENGVYWYDGELTTTEPENFEDGTVPAVSYSATLHFADSRNWGNVNLYTWTMDGMPTGSWPGTALAQGADGFYSMTVNYEAPEGQGLNFIFSGSGQTVDLKLEGSAFVEKDGVYTAEKWVAPTTANDEGKFYADIVDHPDAIAISPQVNGKTVTFQYKDTEASKVQVFGSWDNWAQGIEMEENAYDIWSVTREFDYGLYEYKFVGSKGWASDPVNGWVTGKDQNSAFLISNPDSDTNTVKINVHYDAPSAEWNVCAWGAEGLEPQYDFVDDVATITLDGRANQYVAFKVRRSIKGNDWAEQSGEIRIDLGSIVSGTIDVYVGSDFSVSQSLNGDVVTANKVSAVELDYDNGTITVKTTKAVSDPESAFAIYRNGENAGIIESVTAGGSTYILTLTETLELSELYQYTLRFSEQAKFTDYDYTIGITTVYASDRFAAQYTYTGDDLGANWTADATRFVVWAPTAAAVSVNLYASGTEGTADLIQTAAMIPGVNGIWEVTVEGDLNGTYYTYAVTVDGKTVEAVDPYARTTGVNGKRGMVIDLDSTDPEGWSADTNPNPITSYTDAIIYELHVRDFSIDDSSGVSEANRGKYLAFTEQGTTTANGAATGIDYLEDLGVTHLHLLPVYDYGSVDETKCETFNWGYDPVNYNTPEGSYSTDPYNGEVRVKEFKEMVMALHEADISVIMDVVYNHVYDAGKFCMNRIVPDYFSRQNADGSYSNGSGCGNDTASEREMVRKYIVESVLYWKEEYHIDGFRFDLVGLLDAATINEIVDTVHEKYPDVIFYGEGWTMGTAVEPGNTMATQANSAATPEFAYFSDTIRNLLGGSNGTSLGFVSGLTGQEEAIRDNFMAKPSWTGNPSQIIQYASCHDNYTLIDKLILSTGKSGIDDEIIKMNNLAAAIYMTSQGIPFIHAGEEFLREKLEEDGGRCENSYNASDFVNHIEWSNLENDTYAENSEYYKGLIAFRKAHESLRLASREEIDQHVKYNWITNEVVMFTIDAKAAGDISDSILVIFNANKNARTVNLPAGEWSICINGQNAGTDVLGTATGSVSVDGICAMVLVQGETEPEHIHDWENGVCDDCGETCSHSFADGVCGVCGMVCAHDWQDGHCGICFTDCAHNWVEGICTVCAMVCDHAVHWQNGLCSTCLTAVEHTYSENGLCACGKSLCDHVAHNVSGMCLACGLAVGHSIGADGICTVCTYNQNLTANLAGGMNDWNTSANTLYSVGGSKVAVSVYLESGTYEFKIFYNNGWYGNSGTINGATDTGWVMDSGSNCRLYAPYRGMYTFVYDTAENKLEVYNKITEKLYLRGSFNGWDTSTAMNAVDDNTYTVTVTLDAGSYEFKVATDDWGFATSTENVTINLGCQAEMTVTVRNNGIWTMDPLYPVLENYEYTVDAENGTVILTKYTGAETTVEVAPLYLVDGTVYATVLDSTSVFRDNTKITSVKIHNGVKFRNNTMTYLFYKCSNLLTADLNGLDTAGVTDMSFLFADCGKLTSVDMTDVDTSDVTTTKAMFSYCKKLKTIAGYEDWDTSSLQVMGHMFNYVQSLEVVDLSKWDLSQMINSGWCFQYCYAKQILLPDNLKTISSGFLNHARMYEGTTFTIPVGVEKIGYGHTIYDFSDDDFVEFIVAEGNKNYVAIDGILYSADGREMLAVPRGKTFENNTYVIPEGVDFLGELSFSRNYNIHTVVLPNSYVLEYVPAHDPRYILVDDSGNLNAGLNLNIAIYLYTGITDYAVKDDNPRYASVDGILYSKDMTTVVAIPTLYDKLMDIPEGVIAWDYEAIWEPAMDKCPGVSIPSTLTEISQDQITRLNALNKKYASFEITVHADNPVYGVDEEGYLIVKGTAVARNTDTRAAYATVEAALTAAKAGETVFLLTDCSASTVVVPANVTFDLNGHVLKADNVVSFGAVIDTAETVGGIEIGIDTTEAFTKLQPENGGYLPIYDTTVGQYKFYKYELVNVGKKTEAGKAVFAFMIDFANMDAYNVLANTKNSGISLTVNLVWTGISVPYVAYHASENLIKDYATMVVAANSKSKVMTIKVSGLDNLTSGNEIKAAPVLNTITEVAAENDPIVYTIS